MASREGSLEGKWYMAGSEEMLISDNMKSDMNEGNEAPS